MNNFWDTVETIPEGMGFTHYDSCHLAWLAGFVVFAVLSSVIYRRSKEEHRKIIRWVFAALIVADELFKMVCLFIGDRYMADYLPLHLCSINIFLIAAHAVKPTKLLNNFLYLICIPGALAALLFPTWTELPPTSFMHLHSFSIHILLATYPIMLTAGKDIVPDVKYLPKCMLLLAVLAVPALIVNLLCDTNFMFLMYAEPGNPLYLFETAFGSHLLGFPILIAAVIGVMYLPSYLIKKCKRNV